MKKYYFYHIVRAILKPLFIFIYRPTIINNNKILDDGSLLLVGNHKHAFDPLLVDICTNRTVHALAKSELFEGPFSFFFKRIGAIPVVLDAPKNPEALNKGINMLYDGEIVNISPEAERNYTDKILLPFKKGAVIMSKETNTKVLPYCIVGEYKLFSNNLKIIFGDYLSFENMEIEEANELLYETIKNLLLEHNND